MYYLGTYRSISILLSSSPVVDAGYLSTLCIGGKKGGGGYVGEGKGGKGKAWKLRVENGNVGEGFLEDWKASLLLVLVFGG